MGGEGKLNTRRGLGSSAAGCVQHSRQDISWQARQKKTTGGTVAAVTHVCSPLSLPPRSLIHKRARGGTPRTMSQQSIHRIPMIQEDIISYEITKSMIFRVIQLWSNLPKQVVTAHSNSTFRNNLDKHWNTENILSDCKFALS